MSINIEKSLTKKIMNARDKHLIEITRKEIKSVFCREHNKSTIINSISINNNQLKIDVEYCCDKLKHDVATILAK